MNDNKLVPFGKYRGQPVEVLAQDKDYCDWLATQPWFRERYTTIHTLIINHFKEPTETPEHNALQARFLNYQWCRKFATARGFPGDHITNLRKDLIKNWQRTQPKFEKQLSELKEKLNELQKDLDKNEKFDKWSVSWAVDRKIELEKQISEISKRIILDYPERVAALQFEFVVKSRFEVEGVDVVLDLSMYSKGKFPFYELSTFPYERPDFCYDTPEINATVFIECKPSLGDDYPAVLRQMKANKAKTLVIGNFLSNAISLDQLRAIFQTANIRVLLVSDIEKVTL